MRCYGSCGTKAVLVLDAMVSASQWYRNWIDEKGVKLLRWWQKESGNHLKMMMALKWDTIRRAMLL